MSVATTGPASSGGGSPFGQILSDLDTTLGAVQGKNWVAAGLDGATTGLDVLGSDPLSGLVNAGFGFLTGLVSFLEAPLQMLSGNSGAVTSGSQGFQGSGQTVSSLAGSYSDAAAKETGGWSGPAASGYQNTASGLADGLRTIAKASSGVSSAVEGAGQVVAQATEIITQLIGEATTEINAIMSPAVAAAPVTGGASVAAAIPQAVGVAADYGGQIAGKMGALLSSAQNLASLVQAVVQALQAADKVFAQISGAAEQGSGTGASASTSSSSGLSPASGPGLSPASGSGLSSSSGPAGTSGTGFWIGAPPSGTDTGGSDPGPAHTADQHRYPPHHRGHPSQGQEPATRS